MSADNPFDHLIPRAGAAQNAPDAASQPADTVVDAAKPDVAYLPIPGTIVHGELFPPQPPAPPAPPTPGGWDDPQQYAEAVKQVIPGAVGFAGTIAQGVDVYGAAAQSGAAKRVAERLALLERAERGEQLNLQEDVAGYAQMTPEQRATARAGLERILQQEWVTSPTPVQERPAYQLGEAINNYAKTMIPPAPGYENSFGADFGRGLGTVASGIGLSLFGGPLLAGGAFATGGVGEATQRAVEFDKKERAAGRPGITQDQIVTAGLLGIGPGATDLLPVQVLLGRLPVHIPEYLRRPMAQAIARVGMQAVIEGVQEGGQGFLQDLIAREIYNPQQVLGENFQREAEVGAAVGGFTELVRQLGAGMVRSAAGRRGPSQTSSQQQPPQAAPEATQRQEPLLPWSPSQEPVSPPAAPPAAPAAQAAQSAAVAPAAAPASTVEQAPAAVPTPAVAVPSDTAPPGGNPFADLVPANTNARLDPQWLSQLADTLAASRQPDKEPDTASRPREQEPQQEPALEPLAQPDIKPVAQAGPQRIVTPDGSMEIEAVPVVVELDDLRLAEGSLQPRDRSRAEYTQGARERASQLDPARLQPDRTSDRGAPIILIDGTVISGNGRTMSIAEVYRNPDLADRAEAYRASLGPSAQGMRQPVLVMQAQSLEPQHAQRFADLSNRSAIAQMSATERAMRDAQALGLDGVALYQGGDFTAPQNRRFLQDFMTRVVTAAEMPSVSRNGELTQEGAQRLRSAVLASAYGDAGVLSRMLESTDDNVRAITAGLLDAAPKMAQLRAAIASGEVAADMDAVPALMAAINTISDLRSRRVPVQTWLAQTDAFGRDPVIEAWVKSFYYDDSNRAKRQEKIAQLLNDYAGEAILHRPGGLFTDETTPADVLGVARRKNDASQADDLFAPTGGVGQGVPESRKRAEGRPDATGRQGTGQGEQADEILAALQYAPPSIDRDARELIRDAQRYERELRASGATADQIASEFTRYYGSPVSAADVEAGNVWWARLAGERFDDGGTDKSNISADWSPDLADIIVSSNPLSEGEAASMDVDAKPSQPQRLRGVEGGSSVGPRLTPAMRNAAVALGQQGLNAKQIASELRQQFGQYVRDGEVQAYVDAYRRDTLSAASSAKNRRAASERMAALNARPGFREANAERIRALMATPEMQEILRERGRALAEQKGDTVWTPQMVERLGSPEIRAMTASNAATALGQEFPSARFSANSVNRKRHTLGYSSESGSGKSPFTPDMERRLSDRDMRLLRADEVVARLRAEFGEDATSRITPTTITNKRSGNPSISYIGKTTNPAGFQWSMRGDGRSPDNRLAELMRDKISPAQRADILNKEFGQLGMPSVTPKAVQKRWEKIKASVLKAQGDEPMFAAGGWDPRSWLDWIRSTPNAGREDATSVSRTGDQGGGAPPGQQPGTASVSSGSATEPESGRADGVRQSFRVRDFLGRVVEAPPNSLGLRQSYLFLHPPKVTWPFVKSAATTLKKLDSGVPNWMAKAHVSEIEPGVWQVMNFSVRKKQAADGLTPEFLDAIQSELGDIMPPDQMRPETYQAWRAWEMQGSRWATTSIDDYVEHRGQFYSPEMIRTLHAAARRLATSGGSAEDRNRARREFNELSDLIDRLPPEDDILAAIQAYHGSPHGGETLAVFDPSNIRSINAAFDPAQETSANLMAAVNDTYRLEARAALNVLNQGRPYTVPKSHITRIHAAAKPHLGMVGPSLFGVLQTITPTRPLDDSGKLVDSTATFVAQDGTLFDVPANANNLLSTRAVSFRDIKATGFIPFGVTQNTLLGIRGKLGHENVHVLRRNSYLAGETWDRLVAHGNLLGVLDMQNGTYRAATHDVYDGSNPDQTRRDIYDQFYKNRDNKPEIMDQETVAHMLELYANDFWMPEQIAPVKPILDAILDGSIWRVRQEDAGSALEVRPMDTSDLHQIAQANFDTPYAIDPVQSVPIDSLKGGAYSEKKVGPLAKQISANGWIEPLVVDGDGNVIEGQHRLRAMAKIGAQTVPVHRIRERVPAKLAAAMVKAARDAGIHHDQAQTIAGQIATIIDKEGVAALDEYEPPRGFEKAWDAAVSAAKQGEMELMGAASGNPQFQPELQPLADRARQFKSAHDFMRNTSVISPEMRALDKIAFGVNDGDELSVNPKKLFVLYKDDLENAKAEKQVPYGDDAPPIDVSIRNINGKIRWVIEDGHHRYWAAMRDKKPVKIKIESIRESPFTELGYDGFDEFMTGFWEKANARSDDLMASVQRGRYRNLDPLGYYSRLDEVLSSLNTKDKVTLQTLTSKGVKASEIEARGLMELFTPRQGDRTYSASARDVSMNQSISVPVSLLSETARRNRVGDKY